MKEIVFYYLSIVNPLKYIIPSCKILHNFKAKVVIQTNLQKHLLFDFTSVANFNAVEISLLKFIKSLKHHIYDVKSYPGKRDIFCIHRRCTSFKSKWCWHAKTFWVYSCKVSTKESYHSTFGFHTFLQYPQICKCSFVCKMCKLHINTRFYCCQTFCKFGDTFL